MIMKKIEIQQKIDSNIYDIFNVLKDLMGDNFKRLSASLAGGALRDLNFNKFNEIKDLDLICDLELEKLRPYKNYNRKDESYAWYFNKTQSIIEDAEKKAKKLGIRFKVFHSGKLDPITLNIDKNWKPKNNEMGDMFKEPTLENIEDLYLSSGSLITIVKMSGKDFDIDLLFTNDKNKYIKFDFDFGLCMIEKEYLKNGEKVKVRNFEENIIKSELFLSDEKNKTLTFRHEQKSEPDINRSFIGHLPRLQEKYPYKVVIEEPTTNNSESFKTYNCANYIWVKSTCEKKQIKTEKRFVKI